MPSEAPFCYEIAGTTIVSDIELSGLRCGSRAAARWRIIRHDGPPPEIGVEYHSWRHAWGETWLRFLRAGRERRLIFPGALDVFVAEDRADARCYPHAGIGSGRVQQLIANQVLPLLIGCDRLVLHAGAVALEGRVLALAGGTGEGKSTLVSYLAARGGTVVTDDALVVDEVEPATHVAPWIGPLRLAADTIGEVLGGDAARFPRISDGSDKHVVVMPHPPASRLRLHRVYILEKAPGDRGGMREVTQAIAIRDLMQATFEIAADDPDRVGRTFDRVTRLVRDTPVRVLSMPHHYEQLPHIAELIEHDAG